MGSGGAGLQFGAVGFQFFKVSGAVFLAGHQGAYCVFGGACGARVGHDDLAFPFRIQQVVPGLGRFFLLNFVGVEGDTHVHHTGAGIEAFRIDKGLIDVLCFRRFIFLEDLPIGFESDIVGRVAYPDNVSSNLAAFRFGEDFGFNFAGACEVIVQLNVGIFLFEGFLNRVQLVFLHGRIQHYGIGGSRRFRRVFLRGIRLFVPAAAAGHHEGHNQHQGTCYIRFFHKLSSLIFVILIGF